MLIQLIISCRDWSTNINWTKTLFLKKKFSMNFLLGLNEFEHWIRAYLLVCSVFSMHETLRRQAGVWMFLRAAMWNASSHDACVLATLSSHSLPKCIVGQCVDRVYTRSITLGVDENTVLLSFVAVPVWPFNSCVKLASVVFIRSLFLCSLDTKNWINVECFITKTMFQSNFKWKTPRSRLWLVNYAICFDFTLHIKFCQNVFVGLSLREQ